MANEYPSAKKEPPWLPILPPMPRISVSTNSRARLSHRRPILLSPPTPLPLPQAVVPSTPSPLSSKSPKISEESPILETLPPMPFSASSSPVAAAEVSWPASSSAAMDRVDSAASAPALNPDAVCKPVSLCSLGNDVSSGNCSLLCTASDFTPLNTDECISSNRSDSSVLCPIFKTSNSPALQQSSSCEDDHKDMQENAAGFTVRSGSGANEGKEPDSGKPSEDVWISSGMEFTIAGTTLSATCLNTLEELDESSGADIRVNQENCWVIGREAEVSYLVKDEKLAVDEGECKEGQLADFRKPGKDGCPSSDMGFTVAETTSSTKCLDLPEEEEEFRGAGISVNPENCSHNGREAELPDSVKSEEFVLDEGELEEGQLPGEWSGGEESQEDSESAQTLEESAAVSSVVRAVPIIPKTVNVADQMYYPFQVEEIDSEQRNRGNIKAKGKKKKKHKKGEGSKKRAREKQKQNEVLKKRRTGGKWTDDGSNPRLLRNSKDCNHRGEQTQNGNGTGKFKKAPENLPHTIPKKPTVNEGPEDGEILLESKKIDSGILSTLVEAEVGLWTTDNVDDQFVTEMEQDGAVKKKRGPETAERKLKRKIAKRKKRAQKERELGIRRPPRTTQSKPVKVLCTHYMKGRCAKGDQCTYSHDAVPLTKLEPCKFLMSHSCLKGDDCPYSHDLRAFPCKFFHTRGLCYDGENCKFSHGAISEEALEKLKQRVEKEKKERISSTSAFDIPTPSFSTPLPPELDPDPLGWGTSSTYSTHEELMEHENPTILDQSTHFYGDFNPENHAGTSPAVGMMSGQSTDVSHQSIDRKATKYDAVSPPQIVEKAKECKYMKASNTEALEPGLSEHLGGSKREAESPVPMGLQSTGSPYDSTKPRILKTPVCSSPPNDGSNARKVLEVSRMEGKMDAEHSLFEEPSTNSNASSTRGVLSVHSPLVSPVAAKLVVPLLRGRQLGRLVVEHEKNRLSPLPAESKRQHTVESLLGEALRQ